MSCKILFTFLFGMCIKAFVYHLCHDNHLIIDRDVSTAYCRSLSGDSVDR